MHLDFGHEHSTMSSRMIALGAQITPAHSPDQIKTKAIVCEIRTCLTSLMYSKCNRTSASLNITTPLSSIYELHCRFCMRQASKISICTNLLGVQSRIFVLLRFQIVSFISAQLSTLANSTSHSQIADLPMHILNRIHGLNLAFPVGRCTFCSWATSFHFVDRIFPWMYSWICFVWNTAVESNVLLMNSNILNLSGFD